MYCKFNIQKPCGKCQICRIYKSVDLVKRLKLEHSKRPFAVFVTLTYDDIHLPVFHHSKKAELYKPDLKKFLENLKKNIPKCVAFGVGEYGGTLFGSDKASREIHPHYHICIFSDDPKFYDYIREKCNKYWSMGHAHVLMLSQHLMSYIAGYTVKKLTSEKDMQKVMNLKIRPEFAYYPRNPSLGDISDELVESIEYYGWIEKLLIDGKETRCPKSLLLKVEKKLLTHDLDLKDDQDIKTYERRKKAHAQEKMQMRLEKEQAQIKALNLQGLNYDTASMQLKKWKKQITKNFEVMLNLKKSTKKEKIL